MNPWRGLRGMPKEVWVLFTATLVNRMGTMALPFLVLYLTQRVGLSPQQAGLALIFYGVGALVTAPLSGRLSDRLGSLRIMKASLFLSGAFLFVFPLARSFAAILTVTILWAISNEAFRPANMASIMSFVAPDQRKAAFALNRLAINLGMSVGPAVGGFIIMASFNALFFVDAATSILAGLILTFTTWRTNITPAPRATVSADSAAPPKKRLWLLADPRVPYFLFAMTLVEIVFFQHEGALPLFVVRDLKFSESAYGFLFTINTALIILVEVPLNTAMAHWPHRRAMALGAFLCGAGFGALAFASGFLSVAATVVIWTFGEMILFPSGSAYVADIAPAPRMGEYMGFYVMSFGAAFIIGPWLSILVLEQFGALTLWVASLACASAAAAMLWRVKPADTKETRAAEA
ncbi:MAG TPA: MFS transporter [Blastocatellia bacterium]|jgi:predicted MFS family arabinose efflux permease|nr:MFS transporter [Blastocatellia bacterium]